MLTTKNILTNNLGSGSYKTELDRSNHDLLGVLSWFSVPSDAAVGHEEFRKLIEDNDAPMEAPKQPLAANVFRRACVDAQLKKCTGNEDGVTYDYLIEDAGYAPDIVTRIVIEVRKDKNTKETSTREIGKLEFVKSRGIFRSQALNLTPPWGFTHERWLDIQQSVSVSLDNNLDKISDLNIRESIRNAYRNNLLGLEIKKGAGIYFVPYEKLPELEAVGSVVESIPNQSLHITPLINDDVQFQLIIDMFLDETEAVIGNLIDRVTKLSDNPLAQKVEDIKTEALAYQYKIDIYEDLFGHTGAWAIGMNILKNKFKDKTGEDLG